MPKNYSKYLSGLIGENLVVAELGRRGIVATNFAGNVPEIDILAYKNGKTTPIQVKSLKNGSFSVQADEFLNIKFEGKKQVVKGKKKIDRNLIFAIVIIGKVSGEDRFYICNKGFIQDLIHKLHKSFLKKHDGIRPKNYLSMHCSYKESHLSEKRDNWTLIDDALK